MISILIHFLGSMLIDSAVPPWVGSADSYFLAKWYVAFAALDLLACSMARDKTIRTVLAFSFAWSLALCAEQLMLMDYMQRNDWLAQIIIDTTLIGLLLVKLAGGRKTLRVPE